MAAATLAQTAHRLASRGIRVRLAVELSLLAEPPVSGRYVGCSWCSRSSCVAVVVELVPAVDDDAQPDPVGSAEVERDLCARCLERLVPHALAGLTRVAGHELTGGLQEALREGLGPLLRRLSATDELIDSAVFTVIAAPPVSAGRVS